MVKRLDDIGFDMESALPAAMVLEKKLFSRLLDSMQGQDNTNGAGY
jgi:hypothetical protein